MNTNHTHPFFIREYHLDASLARVCRTVVDRPDPTATSSGRYPTPPDPICMAVSNLIGTVDTNAFVAVVDVADMDTTHDGGDACPTDPW